MEKEYMHAGFDDTDSVRGGCTTYVAALLVERLSQMGAEFVDYPGLVRLNPNVPWKTRGNGALCLRIRHEHGSKEEIMETVIETVRREADLKSKGTDPGIVFLSGREIPAEVKKFSRRTITGIVKLDEALKLIMKQNGLAVGFNERRGIIGGLAAIGETFESDYTFEILAYRQHENLGAKRNVDEASVFQMDRLTRPLTFNNVDYRKKRVIITPRGPDPILFGIRGETADAVKRAFRIVRSVESIERWVIFRSNQGTDAHLTDIRKLNMIRPCRSVVVRGSVCSAPRIVPLRHVIFAIEDETLAVDCAAFEPTGDLRKVASNLVVGDHVEVCGAAHFKRGHSPTINLEKIKPMELIPRFVVSNPVCLKCGKRLKSMGKNKGFRCGKCKTRYPSAERIVTEVRPELKEGEVYATAVRSQRHLTKPLARYGLEKNGEPSNLVDCWNGLSSSEAPRLVL